MTGERMGQEFQEQIAAKIRLAAEGPDRFRVFTPFAFDDGDHLAVVLRKEDARWVLSDEGHTYMHLAEDSDEPDPRKKTRERIMSNALSASGIEDRDGELILTVRDARWADALYSYLQGLIRVASAWYAFREQVKS